MQEDREYEWEFSSSTYSSATWNSLGSEAAVAITPAVADNTAVAETSADDGLVLHQRGVTPGSQTEDAELNCHMRRSYVEQMADHHQEHAAPFDGAVAASPSEAAGHHQEHAARAEPRQPGSDDDETQTQGGTPRPAAPKHTNYARQKAREQARDGHSRRGDHQRANNTAVAAPAAVAYNHQEHAAPAEPTQPGDDQGFVHIAGESQTQGDQAEVADATVPPTVFDLNYF